MKFWRLLISLISATYLIKNANSVDEGGQGPKLYKSFDEIFGKGWDAEVPEFTETKEWHKKEAQTTEVENKSTDQDNPNEQSFSDHFESFANRKIRERFDEFYGGNWSEEKNNLAPGQDESVDEQQNESNQCDKIESDQQKREIIQKFREMKDAYRQKGHTKEWAQIERKISNGLGVNRSTIYKWSKELGLSREKKLKSKFSDLEKREILKQFDKIKSKCKQAKLKNISMRKFDDKIAKKLGVSKTTISEWKRKFGLSASKKKFSDITKIGILKKYAKIKGKNPKMSDGDIADLLKISRRSINNWKAQFREEIKNI